ncbi:ACT domain-containing protein [Vagococcus sp. BWB3-3]|uniref:ACT domain-containing protein n=1 Tax=Vagococcus allomyrinae TaxID=2794353 RepID=A0A940PE49_9ENTE|nr:ACT domain-containing protein [Vagococcus allomyrinae]MBP1043239.1 ACT domain-containing protein [Vagococcus allomyrinae]
MKLLLNEEEHYSVVQFPASYQPNMVEMKGFKSVIWTAEECSVVAVTAQLDPTEAIAVEDGWVLLQISGVLDFALTGILTQIANPLAEAGVSIFALSTYNTDYVLLKAVDVERSLPVLAAAGHQVTTA